jgi:hypothetical protein
MTPGDEIRGGISIALALHFLKHPVHHTDVEVDVFVQAGAEPVNEGHGADVQACLVHMGRTGAVGLQALCNHPQEDAQHHVEHWPVALHEVPQAAWAPRAPTGAPAGGGRRGRQVRRRLHHAPGGARGADSPAFAGEGYKVVVPTVAAASAGKAMGKDAALQILGKRFAHIGLGGVVVALAVELTRAGQL